MTPSDRKLIAICASAIAVAVLVLVGALLYKHRSQSTLASTTPTPAASVAARQEAKPAITGVDPLVNIGLSSRQADALRFAIRDYNQKSKLNLDTVSIDEPTIAQFPHDRTSTNPDKITWRGKFNGRTDYAATLEYRGFTEIHLWLYQPIGTQVYDSGIVTLYK